jgi:glycosyltransferase involved in cell wall biosynthesis
MDRVIYVSSSRQSASLLTCPAMSVLEVTILTPIPSPYQVEMWDAVARHGVVRPRVIYVGRTHPGRQWAFATPAHEHLFLDTSSAAVQTAADWVSHAELFVASWYADWRVRRLIAARAATGKPWVYWGERPGFSGWHFLSRLRRRWLLAPLHRSTAPIWGIGEWAVEGWRQEFGNRREYMNFPYFSDLSRFAPAMPRPPKSEAGLRFLFSGSLIPRKGVDLLADSFSEVAKRRPITLEIMGSGKLESVLRAKLAVLGDRVEFSGFCPWSNLPAAYHRADVLVAPSRYDGWGLIVPEGLAAGLPVIATDRMGSALELIRPGENGWIVSAGSGDALRNALAEAADLPKEKLNAMSVAAVESVSRHQLGNGVTRFEAACQAALSRTK